MPLGLIVVYILLGVVVIATALGMLLSRNAIYAALFLVLNFASVAVLYLTLGAPFIALAQISVYAGAIMVLFLFVIMLLGGEMMASAERSHPVHTLLSIVIGVVFLGEAVLWVVIRSTGMSAEPLPSLSPDFASPAAIGTELFQRFLLPFEVTAIILLVAVIGAIFLTRRELEEKSGMSANYPQPPIQKERVF